jgi:hypothetical protein
MNFSVIQEKKPMLHQKHSNFEIIIMIFILVMVLVFEITPNASFSPTMMKMKTSNKIQKNHNMLPIIIYKRPEDDHIIVGITTGSIVFFSRHPFSSSSDDKKRKKLQLNLTSLPEGYGILLQKTMI